MIAWLRQGILSTLSCNSLSGMGLRRVVCKSPAVGLIQLSFLRGVKCCISPDLKDSCRTRITCTKCRALWNWGRHRRQRGLKSAEDYLLFLSRGSYLWPEDGGVAVKEESVASYPHPWKVENSSNSLNNKVYLCKQTPESIYLIYVTIMFHFKIMNEYNSR